MVSNVSPCLVVFAKRPQRGKVKTRIAATLGEQTAAELCQCALDDTLTLALSIADVARVISYAPATEQARRYFESGAAGFTLMPQRGTTLGERLCDTFAQLLKGHSPVVAIGSDSPDLPPALITRAFESLRDCTDVVIGPASDGGYYLIGMRSLHAVLFERIDWSTGAVARQTRARALAAELRMVELPPWHDLDTVADLRALVDPGAPLTRAFVASLPSEVVDENPSSSRVEGW